MASSRDTGVSRSRDPIAFFAGAPSTVFCMSLLRPEIGLRIFVHAIRCQQLGYRPPAQFAVLVVGFRYGGIWPFEFIAEYHVMRAVAGVAGTISVIEVLERAEQPRVRERSVVIRFALNQAGEGFREPLVFHDHTAGDEVAALCRLIVAQAEQHFSRPLRMIRSMATSGVRRATVPRSA